MADREHLIWRPNHIPQDEWESKTRDEQIAYWQRLGDDRPEPNRKMIEVPRLYEKGMITANECFSLICKRATADQVSGFLTECPNEIMQLIRDELSNYVGDDIEKWPRTYYMVSCAPWVSADEIKQMQKLEQQEIWDGVKLLKSHLMGC